MAVVPVPDGGELIVSADELAELRDSLHEVRADLREMRAEFVGRFETLAASKSGDHKALGRSIDDVRYDLKTTDAAVAMLQEALGRFPRQDWAEKLERGMSSLEDKVTEFLGEIRTTQQDHETRLKTLEHNRAEVQDWKKWAIRTVLAPVLVAVVLAVAVVVAALQGPW